MSEEVEEQAIPPTSAAVLAELMVIARGLMRQAEAAGVTSETVRVLEGLRKIAMSGLEVELREAKIRALQTERQVEVAIGRQEQILDLYESIFDRLQSPEAIEEIKVSLGYEIDRMRREGVRSEAILRGKIID